MNKNITVESIVPVESIVVPVESIVVPVESIIPVEKYTVTPVETRERLLIKME